MIDLSKLPMPSLVEDLDFEAIYAGKLDRFKTLWPDYEAALESDPVVKLLELSAYDEMMYRARVNDAGRASFLAYAGGADLDNRAADFGVQRLLIQAADPEASPPIDAIWEDDERLRYRAQMALEGLSVAGSRGAYLFHALSASADIADASVDSPTFHVAELSPDLRQRLPAGAIVLACNYSAGVDAPLPGDVVVTVLPKPGIEAAPLLERVSAALSADDVRPLTDRPRVQAGQPQPFAVVATIEPEDGPDADVVLSSARVKLEEALTAARKLAGEVPRSAIFAALHVPGVRRAELAQPTTDIRCDLHHYPDCVRIELGRTGK